VKFEDLGRMPYKEAWDYQTGLHNALIDRKRRGEAGSPTHHLLFVEHDPVYTLGKSGSMDNLLVDDKTMDEKGVSFFKINRGGDITYHGPGQIVVYPIFDLDYFKTDVRWFVHHLEETVIQTIAAYGVKGKRNEKHTGVWIENERGSQEKKICALGVHLSRWVSLHGIAFNVNTDLDFFDMIIPCGIADRDKTVTSLSRETGKSMNLTEVKDLLKQAFAKQFDFEYL
jgi:lipoyl(octanoyl) transferase